jgi:CPA1 family monovalent cation:H+ antiporter
LLGYILGKIAIYFLKHVGKYEGAVILTLAVVTGGYSFAMAIGVSGPIAMVITGLMIGQRCRKPFFSYAATRGLYDFWGLVDDVLNAFLFVMIGLEVLSLHIQPITILIGSITFVLLVLARGVAVFIPTLLFVPFKKISFKMLSVMSWGGLRGGLSIALALSIPHITNPMAEDIITITYTVVVLSIILQGLSLQPMLNRFYPSATPKK